MNCEIKKYITLPAALCSEFNIPDCMQRNLVSFQLQKEN